MRREIGRKGMVNFLWRYVFETGSVFTIARITPEKRSCSGSRRGANLLDGAAIRIVQSSAQGIDQQVFHEGLAEIVLPFLQQRCGIRSRSRYDLPLGKVPEASISASPSLVRQAPIALKFSKARP